jgi:D-3-phosphoglycerate dehydrogenase / 2-oxoglutarate reductase
MKILFIDTVHPLLATLLQKEGHECIDGSKLSLDEIKKTLSQYEGAVIRSRFIFNTELLDCGTNLKFIARAGAGMENIDVDYARQKGIECINSPEGNRDAVGEQAIAMLLALFNNLLRADKEVREGKWIREGNRGVELQGKTIGIIGYGNTGSVFAKKLSGFECNALAYDKYKKGFGNSFVKEAKMQDIFNEADILSLHIPLTNETEYLVNDSFIQSFKKNFYLINTSRGRCMNTDDIVANLKSGKILGACLDVNEYEDISFESSKTGGMKSESWDYLISSDKVVLTPHIAGWTHESNEKMARVLFEKIKKQFG